MSETEKSRSPLIANAIALSVACFVGLSLAIWWDHWVRQKHPFGAILPLGLVAAGFTFLAIHHGWNAVSAGKLRMLEWRQWLLCGLIAAISGAFFFLLSNREIAASKGRMMTVLIYSAATSGVAVVAAWTTRLLDGEAVLRSLLSRGSVRIGLLVTGMFCMAALLFAAVEIVCWSILRTRPAGPSKIYEGEYLGHGFTEWDDNLGTRLNADQDVACLLKIDGRTVWDVRYSTDEYGRRTTINSNPDTDQYAIFFGCSFLFGEGANDGETIPSEFARNAADYRAYNYGVPGYGTQQMLAKLQTKTIRDEVNEKNGVVVYIYLEDVHEPRVVGGMQITSGSAWNFPYYDLAANGSLQRFGNFTTGRPVLSKAYWLLNRSNLVRLMGLNFPKRSDEHYQLLAKIVEASKAECETQLNGCRFYVACFPRSEPHRKLLPYLEEMGIPYLDYSDLFDPDAPENYHSGDGHPTPFANAVFGKQLALDVAQPSSIRKNDAE